MTQHRENPAEGIDGAQGRSKTGSDYSRKLDDLKALSQWLIWRYKPSKTGKPTKVPFQSRRPDVEAKTNDPTTWSDFDTAVKAAKESHADGIGFVLAQSRAFDLDDCRDKATGEVAPWALELIERAPSYSEVTPSEQGLRIIGAQGDGSRLYRKQKIDDGGWWKLHGLDKAPSLESYRNCEKYITITGNVFRDLPPANLDQVMDEVVAELDKKPNGGAYHARLEEDDSDEIDDLIKNGCGDHYGGDRSRAVWRVITELVRRGTSATVIESVLLARDNRISDHIYDQSNPVEYVRRQIAKAIDERRGEQIARNIEIGEDVTEPILPTILTLPEMIDRLVFIGSSSSVADRLTGRIRKKEAAKEEYAASKYKKAQALKLWIGSPQRLTVDVINWIPGAKTICRPLETSEGAQAWRYLRQEEESKGDTMEYAEARAAFHKRLGIKIGSPWPIDVWDPEPPEAFTKAQDAWAKQRYLKAWRRAYELNCELERLAFE